ADGAPKQPAKVNDQIGRYVAHTTIDFLGRENGRVEWTPLIIRQSLEAGLDLVPEGFVITRWDDALWLAPLDVEKYTGIVPPLTPDPRLGPVDLELRKGRHFAGMLLQHQQ